MTGDDDHDRIMTAVGQALRTHGYADLTMQDIAAECDVSTAALHYHYDTKADLLAAFLEGLLDDNEQRLADRGERPPVEQLCAFIAWFVFGPDDQERIAFHLALLEMRSRGPHDARIRDQLVRSDRLLRETVAAILAEGIDAGAFESVDIEETAALIVATLDGARTRQITLGGESVSDEYTRVVADGLLARLVDPLLAAGVDRPSLDEILADAPEWAQ